MNFCVSQKGSDDEEEIVMAVADFAFHMMKVGKKIVMAVTDFV